MNDVRVEDFAALESIVAQMERAWNAADGVAFAAPFALDADQVNIFGTILNGRSEIAERHQKIFDSIFSGSRNTLRVIGARHVSENIILARLSSVVEVPDGPLKGELKTLGSLLFRRTNSGWELVTFHNTAVAASD